MKKIVILLYSIVFIILSFFTIDFFANYETYKYTARNMYQLQHYDKIYAYSQQERINMIKAIAKEEKVNIYQFNHDVRDDGTEISIYYYALGDEKLYNEKFDTDKGLTRTFNPRNEIYSLPIEDTLGKQVRTHLFIEGRDKQSIESAVDRLTSKEYSLENFEITKNNFFSIIRMMLYSDIFLNIFLILILLIPTTFYFYYIKLQEIYVKKSLGFNPEEIKLDLIKDITIIQGISIVPSIIFQFIYLYKYNKVIEYILFYIIICLIIMLLLFIFNIITVIFIKIDKIVLGLKHKRPYIKMMIMGKLFSIITLIVILNILNSSLIQMDQIKLTMSYIKKWETLKEYQNFNFGYIDAFPTTNRIINEYNASDKAQDLYKVCEENGAILVNPRWYSPLSENAKDRLIITNANYIYLEQIKDETGTIIDDIDKDKLTILIPIKYKGTEQDVIDAIQIRVLDLRFYIEQLYMEKEGTALELDNDVEIEIRYIQNDQETFIYGKKEDFSKNNYARDPVLICTNSNILGKSLCLSYMTKSYFKAYVGDERFTVANLNNSIQQLKAGDMIKVYNSYNEFLAEYIMNLHKGIERLQWITTLIIIAQISIIVANVIIHNNNFKQINYIQKIHGYSFWHRHYKYIVSLLIEAILVIFLYHKYQNNIAIKNIYIYILIRCFMEIYILKKYEKNSIIEILKRR